jgi:hypothetical protein
MADLAFHALGVDLVEIALRQALGEDVPDELVYPRQSRPTAIRFLTARPGPLPVGKVTKVSGLDRVLRAPGVVQADVFLQEGETIRPVRPRRRPPRLRDRRRADQRPGPGARGGGGQAPLRRDRVGMGCAFDLGHYRELLDSATAGGYRWAFFDTPPEAGTIILRHDVDLSLDAALRMAELEAEAGAGATYFLMTRSEFYNLDSESGRAAIARLRELGHRVGLHAVWPDIDHDDRFDPVLAWHNPTPSTCAIRSMGSSTSWSRRGRTCTAPTRTSTGGRGCPHEELAAGSFERLQLLTHPEIWAYPGATMRETMLAMLDAERERRLEQLAADRIDLS